MTSNELLSQEWLDRWSGVMRDLAKGPCEIRGQWMCAGDPRVHYGDRAVGVIDDDSD